MTGARAGIAAVATYELEFYQDENGDEPVRRWLREEATATQWLEAGSANRKWEGPDRSRDRGLNDRSRSGNTDREPE